MTLILHDLRSRLLAPTGLEVADGAVAAIRGASGSGKTVLLRAIADLDPSEGEVAAGRHRRSAMSGPAWRRLVRFVAAEPAWWADRVGDHFRDPVAAVGVVERLGLPPDCMGWTVARLSTGEKQRLGFVRAVEDRPPVLLLDEPTSALDEQSEAAVEASIREMLRAGACAVLVTHSEAQAERLAARRFVMEAGRLAPERA